MKFSVKSGRNLTRNSDVFASNGRGSLLVVGTGIRLGQLTMEGLGAIQAADIVLTVVGNPTVMAHLLSISKKVEDLVPFYREGKDRTSTYRRMARRVLKHVRSGKKVCLALYGHPGVLADPPKLAIEMARREGYSAEMMPGISSEACMFADLGIDIGESGLQSYEASGFLLWQKTWDPSTLLVLWQVGMVGDPKYHVKSLNRGISRLVDKLVPIYGEDHLATIYEAATMPLEGPRVDEVPLQGLAASNLTASSTLVLRPSHDQVLDRILFHEIMDNS